MVLQAEGGASSAKRADRGASDDMPDTIGLMLEGKNINQTSFLATDYLNHFNDVIMLLDLLPSMPECLDDVTAWEPMSYAEHFQQSGLSDKELAILAYDNAPEAFRGPFDQVIGAMDRLILDGRREISCIMEQPESDQLGPLVAKLTDELRYHIEIASAIIHGKAMALAESAGGVGGRSPDHANMSSTGEVTLDPGEGLSQNDIDALFD